MDRCVYGTILRKGNMLMSKNVDIEFLKYEGWKSDLIKINEQFRAALVKHFEVVELKTNHLINSRWE